MAYRLSATKLNRYRSCPQAFYFQYERKLPGSGAFASPVFGNALHQALAFCYQDWHYGVPYPPLNWISQCWERASHKLSAQQQIEGFRRLQLYYERFIELPQMMSRPLGVETWIKASVQFDSVFFDLRGKYDRLDYFDGGLSLVDYKSGQPPNYSDEPDLQLGFYDLILQQTYGKALIQWKHIYLKTGEEVIYTVTDSHREQVRETIKQLSISLKNDRSWIPCPGDHCDRCSYRPYCLEASAEPEPLPTDAKEPTPIQFALSV